jgi:tetratricopeptide (TPR) repeat protein
VSTAVEPTGPVAEGDAPGRPADLALARLHLRLGSLALARTELEQLADAGELDGPARVDLAEVRWRTGDLIRAGEAATDALNATDEDPVALVIAAEAAAALGRPNEARRLAMRAMDRIGGPVDAIFAGMPRSAVWPADATEPPPTTTTLFQQEPIAAPARRVGDDDSLVTSMLRAGSADAPATPSRSAVTPGFWDVDGDAEPEAADLPDPAEELEAAARALAAGALDEAALRFALTLRLAPALAPAVLEATDGLLGAGGAAGSGAAGPALSVVRGDAFRLVGLEVEARRAYAMAAWSGARDRRRATAPQPEAAGVSDTIPPVPRARSRVPRTRTPR